MKYVIRKNLLLGIFSALGVISLVEIERWLDIHDVCSLSVFTTAIAILAFVGIANAIQAIRR